MSQVKSSCLKLIRFLRDGKLLNGNKLSEDQLKLMESPKQCCLVLAGPGSGKTTTIIFKVYYLMSIGVDPSHINVLSFTKKAVREIIERMKNLEEQFKMGKLGYNVSTYHSFLLKRLGVSNENILEPYSQKAIVKFVMKNYSIIRKCFTRKKALRKISSLKFDRCLGKELSDIDSKLIKVYLKEQGRYNKLDYTDILTRTYLKLVEKNDQEFLRGEYLILDEAQDLDILILNIFTLGDPAHVFAVGDDMQRIFSFEGNMGDFLEMFSKKCKDESSVFTLFKNRRSIPPIVNLCSILRSGEESFKNDDQLLDSEKYCIDLITTLNTDRRNSILLHLITMHINEKKSFVILARTNKEVLQLDKELKKKKFQDYYFHSRTSSHASKIYITITTLHKSKGGEWDSVAIVNLSEGVIPMLRSGSTIEEEKKLLFVGVSRAKFKIYLMFELNSDYIVSGMSKKRKTSRFINQILPSYIKKKEYEDFFPPKKISFELTNVNSLLIQKCNNI